MPTKDNYNKTLRFSAETDDKLGKAANSFGLSKFQFFNQMVEYFYRTKKDPADINDEVLKRTLAKNHDTYIRFIRAQEEKILIPVKVELDRMVVSQIKIIESFNGQVLNANKALLSGQQVQAQQTEKLMQTLKGFTDTKESLKQKFIYILNFFHKATLNASSKEKETLLQEAVQHITKL
ncbi:hypothetical protein SAMN05421821_10272 [Mucilaginibacter lappiensis]|uniref:Mg2+ and Co2+ transporter CorA n=1 Tax=Mucilaginibacter lappiensis TaxID=354630 RepID=A0ABR6PG09_9SPHI|nr:BfmA/BtgA family mobilization protein [Mucilaginibacter lappiensis]MBB6108693.1 Mg2+ and Co2+ transporter CorA [Mucilaginibacter lappiensis]SIQ27524.1 hypothetical protein SAMN05421821_10272 [Mucilaginibacter lappiensis]